MATLGEFGIYTPPKPFDPCICSAKSISPLISQFEPETTLTSNLPTLNNKSNAFLVVFLREVFPGDVDIPSKLILGCRAAKTIAKASSNPGSQSSHSVY